jgi:uncharacterized protein (TIGR03435 family)
MQICWAWAKGIITRYGETVDISAGTIADLIEHTQVWLDRPIVDMTELKGNFMWQVAGLSRNGAVFSAFEDQLGLKLERTDGPFEVIVVDHVSMPTPN